MQPRHPAESAQHSLAGQRVLVTGATGFIGSALCRVLIRSGAEVHGTSRVTRSDGRGIRWWQTDLTEPNSTTQLVRAVKPDLVIHLASHVSGERALAAVDLTLRNNLLTTVNLFSAACDVGGPRIVIAGSMEECDAGDPNAVPGSPYAAAKTAAGTYARLFHSLYGLAVVHLRIFMVYGPGQRDETKLIPYVTTSLLRGERPALTSGVREIDWIYVDDVVAAIIAAALAEDAAGETVDIGSGELTSIRAVVDKITQLVGGLTYPRYGARTDRPLERVRVANLSRAAELLGWQPATSLEEGLEMTVRWYRTRQNVTEDSR